MSRRLKSDVRVALSRLPSLASSLFSHLNVLLVVVYRYKHFAFYNDQVNYMHYFSGKKFFFYNMFFSVRQRAC